MVAKVALGHGVLNAVNREPHYAPGRLCILGTGGTADDRYGSYAGYDGFGSDQAVESSDRCHAAVIKWLTGKSTGANIFIAQSGPPTPAGYAFGQEFQAGLTRMGHSFTLRGESTWNDSTWDPLDYDMACLQGYNTNPAGYHGVSGRENVWDYLLTHGGNVLDVSGGGFAPWGFPAGTLHWSTSHSGGDGCSYIEFEAEAEFGESEHYKYVMMANVVTMPRFAYGGDSNFVAAGAGRYTAAGNSHGGHAWVTPCVKVAPHAYAPDWTPYDFAAACFWTYE